MDYTWSLLDISLTQMCLLSLSCYGVCSVVSGCGHMRTYTTNLFSGHLLRPLYLEVLFRSEEQGTSGRCAALRASVLQGHPRCPAGPAQPVLPSRLPPSRSCLSLGATQTCLCLVGHLCSVFPAFTVKWREPGTPSPGCHSFHTATF